MEYKEKMNSYYREKSKQETAAKRKGLPVHIVPLDRVPFQDIRKRMMDIKARIQRLEEMRKQYEMDISYDLHDTLEEFDRVEQELKQAHDQYKELLNLKEKKEETLRKEYTDAADALSRLADNYRQTDDLAERKELYKQQRPFQQKMLSRFMREMKEEGEGYRLYTLYRPIHEVKV